MTGRLALAGLYPEETPLRDWTAAAFAVLVDLGASGAQIKGIDKFAAELERPIPGDLTDDDLDADTWGTSVESQAAQRNLMSAFGIRPPEQALPDDGGDEPDGAA